MPTQNVAVNKFNRGRIARLALARTDIARLESSAEEQTNWVPRVLGSMMLRPGWKYLSSTLGDAYAYNIPFVKSTDDVALIELTNESMRVRVDDAVVTRNAVSTTVRGGDFSADITTFNKLTDLTNLTAAAANTLAFSHDGQLIAFGFSSSPTLTTYTISGTTFTEGQDIAAGITVLGVTFSPDTSYCTIVGGASPFVKNYPITGTTLGAALSDPASLPAGAGNGVAWSADGTLLAVAHTTSPYCTVYQVSGSTFTKLTGGDTSEFANSADLPTGTGSGVAFSNDGQFMAVAHTTSPYVTIYEINGTTFTKLADPGTLPTGDGKAVAFTRDGLHLAVAHTTTPFVTIYSIDGTTFTKLSNPATLPDGNATSVSFSSDNQYLCVGHATTAFITIYRYVSAVWTKQTDPSTLPDGNVNGVAFSPNNRFLATAHATSAFHTIYEAYQWLDMDGSGASSTYGGASPASFETAFTRTLATSGIGVAAGASGMTIRQWIDSSDFTRTGDRIKVTFQTLSSQTLIVTKCYIGKAASSGDVYDFASAPTQITFSGGSAGFTLGASSTKVSDEIVFDFDGSDIVIAFHVTNTGDEMAASVDSESSLTPYYKQGADDTSTINATGYTSLAASRDVAAINKIEVLDEEEGGSGLFFVGTGFNEGRRVQAVSLLNADVDVEHGLKVVVDQGRVLFHIGSEFAGSDLVAETYLEPGTYSFAFTPTTNLFFIDFRGNTQYSTIVTSCQIETSGDMTLTTPYTEAILPSVRYAQSGDVVYLAGEGVKQMKIERRATRSWALVDYLPKDGPFRTVNTTLITITPSALTGDITLTASRDLFREGMVGTLFRITSVGQNVEVSVTAQNQFSSYVKVTGAGTVRNLSIVRSGTWSATVTLQRSVSEPGTWTDVATFTTNGTATYNDALDNQIIYYRIGVKTGNYTSGTAVLSMSYTSGGIDGIARVTEFTSETVVNAIVLTAMGGTSAFETWNEGLWSEYRGYPSSVALYEGRLWWAGYDKVIGSISDSYESFDDTTEGDSGPISRSIGEGPVDTINWLLPIQRLLVGTEGSELSAKSNSFDEPLTPTNFTLKACSTHGSGGVGPVRIDDTGVFTHRTGTRVMQLAYDVDTYDYASSDLTQLVPEMCDAGIRRMAVQRLPDTRVHVVLDDGTAALLIFDKSEDVICWIDIETDGEIEDVAILPGTPEDMVYYVVQRTINSETKRYLEKWALESECVGGTLNKQADSFILYSGVSTTSITGLDHLEGESVVVWGNGAMNGTTYTVASGAITLSTAVTSAVIGLTYRARYKSVKLAYGAAGGTALTKRKRITGIALICADLHYQGLTYGDNFSYMRSLPGVYRGKTVAADTIHTEYDDDILPMNSDWGTDSRLCLEANAPKPATVLAAVISVETNG